MSYQDFKNNVIGQQIGDGECVSLIVNNARAYVEYLFPGVTWTNVFVPVAGAKDMFDHVNTKYFQQIVNDPTNANQVPQQGDVMIFSQTPYPGYTNQYDNPYGHTGICESANSSGYNLLQQNAPAYRAPVNVTYYPWKFRHCIGWLRPINQTPPPEPVHVPEPTPTPAPAPQPPTLVPAPIDAPVPVTKPPVTATVSADATAPKVTFVPTPSITTTVTSPSTFKVSSTTVNAINNKEKIVQKTLNFAAKHLPYIIPILLVVVQALVDNGYLNISNHMLALVNTILVALGFGALHVRSKK